MSCTGCIKNHDKCLPNYFLLIRKNKIMVVLPYPPTPAKDGVGNTHLDTWLLYWVVLHHSGKNLRQGQCDQQWIKVSAARPEDPSSSSKIPVGERRINSHTVSSDFTFTPHHSWTHIHAHICTQNKEDILTLKLILEVGIWPSGRVLAHQMRVPGSRSQFYFGFFF